MAKNENVLLWIYLITLIIGTCWILSISFGMNNILFTIHLLCSFFTITLMILYNPRIMLT